MRSSPIPILCLAVAALCGTPPATADATEAPEAAPRSCTAVFLCTWETTAPYFPGCPLVDVGPGYAGVITGTWNYGKGYYHCRYTGIGQP